VSELSAGQVKTRTLEATALGLPRARVDDLRVSDVKESAAAIRLILAGEKGPRRDIAVLNAAAALVVAEKSADLAAGLRAAQDAIDSGQAARTLAALTRTSNA
jgi:anthranilate phosphoribosyltransferase